MSGSAVRSRVDRGKHDKPGIDQQHIFVYGISENLAETFSEKNENLSENLSEPWQAISMCTKLCRYRSALHQNGFS
jgi:hypothetical protein